jgi:hypothetical protein
MGVRDDRYGPVIDKAVYSDCERRCKASRQQFQTKLGLENISNRSSEHVEIYRRYDPLPQEFGSFKSTHAAVHAFPAQTKLRPHANMTSRRLATHVTNPHHDWCQHD